MASSLNRFCVLAFLAIIPATSFALPIDWHGAFGVDTTILSDFRRIKSKASLTAANPGSQEVALDVGNKESASWQSYVFKLAPTMIINDAATFKAELTTGYANGGYLGDSGQTDSAANKSIPLNYHNQSTGGSSVNIRKAYLELYSDTATYLIGRHAYNWGLGAIYNDGANTWDRHASTRDGITMKLKIGNFHVHPFWSKVSSGGGLTKSTEAKEMGIGLLYDNEERDITFGILYTVKNSNANNTLFNSTLEAPVATPVGETDVKVTDIFVKKEWGKFEIAAEVPLMSGDLGRTNATGKVTSYSAKAILLQTTYKASDFWTFGFDAGKVAGHDGSTSKFGALYLNPNYQVASVLFRYNLNAVGNRAESIYDSYITNALYLKLKSSYSSEKWTFDTGVIWAKAEEVAKAGQSSYNHTKNKIFTAATTQSDKLGTEVDLNATYKWNNEINVGAGLGYLMTGDYFNYTNSTTVKNETKNTFVLQLNTSVTF